MSAVGHVRPGRLGRFRPKADRCGWIRDGVLFAAACLGQQLARSSTRQAKAPMNRVSLICTVHKEKGNASVPELTAVLDRLQPEVLFLEVPPAALETYLKASADENLEASAVRAYRERCQVELVPVDLATPDAVFFENNRHLFKSVERASPEYRRLIDLHSASVAAYGFVYLNSEHCVALWSDVYHDIQETVRKVNDSALVHLFTLWKETIALRDAEMMRNVLEYCSMETFERGAFLVGAAHRQAIIANAGEKRSASTRVEWDFSGYLGAA